MKTFLILSFMALVAAVAQGNPVAKNGPSRSAAAAPDGVLTPKRVKRFLPLDAVLAAQTIISEINSAKEKIQEQKREEIRQQREKDNASKEDDWDKLFS